MSAPTVTQSTLLQHADELSIECLRRPRRRISSRGQPAVIPARSHANLTRILSVASELNRNAASQFGVQTRCCANNPWIDGIDVRGLVRRVAHLLRRAIQNAHRGSVVTCQIGQTQTGVEMHIRYAQSNAARGSVDLDWIDEFWSWHGGVSEAGKTIRHWQFAA